MKLGEDACQDVLRGGVNARIFAPLAIVAGVATELAVLHQYPGQLTWLPAILIAVGVLAALALAAFAAPRVRMAALAVVLVALLLAPATWAFDTLGYATSGTFPAGGPKSVNAGGPGGFGGGPGGPGGFGAGQPLFGNGGAVPSGQPPGGGGSLSKEVLSYVKQHGGGTIAVESQSSAASAIIGEGADVAGIGGFSGRESDVSIAWLAGEVSSGHIRWVLAGQSSSGSGAGAGRLPGDTRTGSSVAIAAAAKACRKVTLTTSGAGGTGTSKGTSASSGTSAGGGTSGSASTSTLYDCQGRAAKLLGTQQSKP